MKKRYTHVYVTYMDLCDPENNSEYPFATGTVRTFDLSRGSAVVELNQFLKGLSKNASVLAKDSNDKKPDEVWNPSLRMGNGDWEKRREKK